MTRILSYRGPDDEGYYIDQHVGLGHRRLSIIDLSPSGREPLGNEDGSIQLVFNGEIYNFKSLRNELEKRGHQFSSETDAEVIIHGYEEWREEIVQKLQGMFAFALWDENRKHLFLARDRVGKKPLVYYFDKKQGIFLFASELKALLQHPIVGRTINKQGLSDYLSYGYVPAPQTIFEGIFKVMPGHILTIDATGTLKTQSYWDISFTVQNRTEEEAQRQLLRLLEESTRLRMMSDVPLGAFLSGGIDSSAVVAMMSKIRKEEAGEDVKTFSIGFEESGFDERKYARIVAEHCGTDHKEFIVKPDLTNILPQLVWYYNEPFSDSSAIPSFYVAQMARKHVTVALNGDGGDESFAGYDRYAVHKASLLFNTLPTFIKKSAYTATTALPEPLATKHLFKKIKRFVSASFMTPEERYLFFLTMFTDDEKNSLVLPSSFSSSVQKSSRIHKINFSASKNYSFLSQTQYLDFKRYLPDDLLVKMDIATMANSLEARSPFLDQNLIEFAATLPPSLKLHGFNKKYILKKALRPFLPRSILHRKKMGFSVPVGAWLRNDLRSLAEEVVLSRTALQRGYFNKTFIEKLFAQHCSGKKDHSPRLWNLLWLELWHRVYVDNDGKAMPKTLDTLM